MPQVNVVYNPNVGALHLLKTPTNDLTWFRVMLEMIREEVRRQFSTPEISMPLHWVDLQVSAMGPFDIFGSPLNIEITTIGNSERLLAIKNDGDVALRDSLKDKLAKCFGVNLSPEPFLWFNFRDERGRHL